MDIQLTTEAEAAGMADELSTAAAEAGAAGDDVPNLPPDVEGTAKVEVNEVDPQTGEPETGTEPSSATKPVVRPTGGGCFVAGTPVLMADGTLKPIEQLKVGDEVLSRDPATGATAAKRVTLTTIRHKVATLVLHTGDGQAIETTANHPIFIENPKQGAPALVVPAGQLAVGNSILTRAGLGLSLTSIAPTHELKTVYNCTVEGFHTYFVGTSVQNALWVHNTEIPCYEDLDLGTITDQQDQAIFDVLPESRIMGKLHNGLKKVDTGVEFRKIFTITTCKD
jgi:hypothetical protein